MSVDREWAIIFAVVYGLACVAAFIDLWRNREIGTHRWRTLVLLVGYQPPLALFRYVVLIALPIYWVVWRIRSERLRPRELGSRRYRCPEQER